MSSPLRCHIATSRSREPVEGYQIDGWPINDFKPPIASPAKRYSAMAAFATARRDRTRTPLPELCAEPEPFERRQHYHRRLLQFVGAYSGAIAAPAQLRQSLADAGVGPGKGGRVGFLDLDIARQRLSRLGIAAAARRKAAGDQGRHPVADHRRY